MASFTALKAAAMGAADLTLLHHVKSTDRLPRRPPRRKRRRWIEDDGESQSRNA